MFNSGEARLSLREDGTFELQFIHKQLGTVARQGAWTLDGAGITLTPFWTVSSIDSEKIEQHDSMSWFVTDANKTQLAIYGGDCADPDYWRVMSRIK